MKPWRQLAFISCLVIAAISGWFFEHSDKQQAEAPLEIPDNIDYYLVKSHWKGFNDQGLLQYQLRSPYLEHFLREDISMMTQPDILYHSDDANWSIQAENGKMQHKDETIELSSNVRIRRDNAEEPMLITSEHLRLEPTAELAHFDQPLQMDTPQLSLQAQSAVLQMERGQHLFNRVSAVYRKRGS